MKSYADELADLYSTKVVDEVETNYIAVPSITFQVTEACQLRCQYCYQGNKTPAVMSLETAKKFIDLLIANDDNTKQYIDTEKCSGVILDFIGGEPLLQPKLIDDIITYFRTQTILHDHPWQYNWRISISSNGIAYFNPEVQELIKKYKDHLSLSITLDGNKELHDACRKFPSGEGSYDKVIAAIRHYKDYWHGFMGSKVTFSPANIMYAGSAIINLIEEGYTEIHANCVFEKGWEYSDGTIFYNEMKKIADYILDNNLEYKVNISLFVENFFKPLGRDNTQNWCWGAGTPILTDQGYKPIEKLKIGDKVYTADGTIHPIINTMSHFADNCVNIKCDEINEMVCTNNHQVFAKPLNKPYGKYQIQDLGYNDLIETLLLVNDNLIEQDGKLWTSHLTVKPAEPQIVYNITVDTNHSYIAGGIVSSNCGGNGRMLSLGPDGCIYPCLRYAPSSLGDVKPIVVGDVDNGIMTTQEQRDTINELKAVNRINQSTEECIDCPIAAGCSYCQSYNYQDSGNFHHRATYICPTHKARALANVYYWNKFYIKNLSGGRFKNYLPDEEALKIIDKEELQKLKDLENTPIPKKEKMDNS